MKIKCYLTIIINHYFNVVKLTSCYTIYVKFHIKLVYIPFFNIWYLESKGDCAKSRPNCSENVAFRAENEQKLLYASP